MNNDLGRDPSAPEFRPCPGFEAHYMVVNTGHVLSMRSGAARILAGDTERGGYKRVLLSLGGSKYRRKVHRLVCEAFHGACPETFECAHLDGNPSNNAASNLKRASRSENSLHKAIHGTNQNQKGAAHPCAKLDLTQVSAIRAGVESNRAAARTFGVSETQIRRIRKGARW